MTPTSNSSSTRICTTTSTTAKVQTQGRRHTSTSELSNIKCGGLNTLMVYRLLPQLPVFHFQGKRAVEIGPSFPRYLFHRQRAWLVPVCPMHTLQLAANMANTCINMCVDITAHNLPANNAPFYPMNAVQVSSNGVYIDFFESSAKSTFTAFAVHADAVQNLTLRSNSNQYSHEGFSLLEVRNRARPTPSMNISVDLCSVRGGAYGFLRASRSKSSTIENVTRNKLSLRDTWYEKKNLTLKPCIRPH